MHRTFVRKQRQQIRGALGKKQDYYNSWTSRSLTTISQQSLVNDGKIITSIKQLETLVAGKISVEMYARSISFGPSLTESETFYRTLW